MIEEARSCSKPRLALLAAGSYGAPEAEYLRLLI
jgi:hypothetical protein